MTDRPTHQAIGDGLLIVDKPSEWTSHDVVGRARRLCATRKVGHAGTLDPMATGVLVLGVNRATRLLTFLVGADKSYTATIRLGQSTLTDDAQGEITARHPVSEVTDARIEQAVAALTGAIQQVPSAVSAIKVNGQRSYARVRAGEQVELAARPVTVSRFDIHDIRRVDGCIDLDVEVDVSSGTYVRALARDLGGGLGVGGHLTALRRTRVGGFTLDHAATLEELDPEAGPGPAPYLISLADAARAGFTTRQLSEPEARALGYGQRIDSAQPGRVEPVAALAPDGSLVAMVDESGSRTRAHVVFAPAGGS